MSSKSILEPYTERLNFYQKVAPDGCLCLSFYDLIRFYDVDLLRKNRFIYKKYPISYIDQHPDLRGYDLIASYITFSELLVYKNIRDILLNDYINTLSINPQISFYYILDHPEYKWNFMNIAQYNHTLNERDLYHPNLFTLTVKLSFNSSIPLEWILNHQKITVKNWNSVIYILYRTFKELVFLSKNHPEISINWITVTRNNDYITAENILDHPEYPWDYGNYHKPTISYYNAVKSRLNDREVG